MKNVSKKMAESKRQKQREKLSLNLSNSSLGSGFTIWRKQTMSSLTPNCEV